MYLQKIWFILVAFLMVCSATVRVCAQNETAVLAGQVTDPSGSAVPNAQVSLVSDATGAARNAVTSPSGEYRFDLLEPGDYSLRVTVNGFRVWETPKLHLQVAQTSQFNLALVLGSV